MHAPFDRSVCVRLGQTFPQNPVLTPISPLTRRFTHVQHQKNATAEKRGTGRVKRGRGSKLREDAMEGAGAIGRGGGGGGGNSSSGGGSGGEEKQVVAAATAAAGQALRKQAARRAGREKREVEEEQHQLVPVIPYTRPPPLDRKARVSIESESDKKCTSFFLFFFVSFSPFSTTLIERFRHDELDYAEV